jgi:hypothetical protein
MAEAFDAQNLDRRQLSCSAQTRLNWLLHGRLFSCRHLRAFTRNLFRTVHCQCTPIAIQVLGIMGFLKNNPT